MLKTNIMRPILALSMLIFSTWCTAENSLWPDLSKTCFVKSKPASDEDAKKGCAAFVIKKGEQLIGTPINIEIPQYAYHVDHTTGKKTPVVIIQAEENSNIKAVGYKEVGTSTYGAALLEEMNLLGSKKPPKPQNTTIKTNTYDK